MTAQQAPLQQDRTGRTDDAGHFAQLCAIVALVERMAPGDALRDPVPDGGAIAEAYRRAPAVARRRFDELSREVVRSGGSPAS
ncbi:MAG: hypothetical protein LC634_09490 [Sphingomonadales bacterium]|nr:hypothetical protein [Sphingomonadales bacterium]